MSDAGGPRPAPFCYLHVRTPYGPGGGPGPLAAYAEAAAGYPALACSDYGSVAAWPEWERATTAAGIRPLYGLGLDLQLDTAGGPHAWPVLALAATGVGLRHLIQIHNRLQRAPGGRCTLDGAALPDLAAGLWIILLPAGDWGPSPLVGLPRRTALAAVERLAAGLPRAEQLLCGLPSQDAEQAFLAELAGAMDLPLLALPLVRYPRPVAAAVHTLLFAAQHPEATPLPSGFDQALASLLDGAGGVPGALEPPEQAEARYAAYPDAWHLAGAVGLACVATLADLAPAERPLLAGSAATLAAVVDEALAAEGRARDAPIEAELAALERGGGAAALLAARRVAAAARQLGVLLGAAGGVAGEGRIPTLLGLCPADPFGLPPRWLGGDPLAGPGWEPQLAVPAIRRAGVLGLLHDGALRQPGAAGEPLLLPAGAAPPRGPAVAVAAMGAAFAWPAAQVAALEQALVAGRSGERAVRWRTALPADLPGGASEALLEWASALEALPGTPRPDGEILLVLPAAHGLPLLPLDGAPDRRFVPWAAADCVALGAGLLVLRGDRTLDILQRAAELVASPGEAVATDALRLLLAGGNAGGLPLPLPAGPDGELETTPDVLAAVCAALLPDDPDDTPGWAALGALLYGARGPHPWLRTYLRRRVGAAPVTYHYPALAAILDLTWGLPLYDEQVRALRQLTDPGGPIPADASRALQDWIGQAAAWARPYGAALADGLQVQRALSLKAGAPAAYLAAALEQAVYHDDAPAIQALAAEAPHYGLVLRRPDVQAGPAAFALDDRAICWGLAWSLETLPAAQALVAARAREPEGRFASLAALCTAAVAAQVPAATLAGLIRVGACDALGPRTDLLQALPMTYDAATRAQRAREATVQADQPSLFDGLPTLPPPGDVPGQVSLAGPADATPPGLERAWELALAGHAFGPRLATEAFARPGGGAMVRLTLAGIGAAHVGQVVSVAAVLSALHVLPADGNPKSAEMLAVALAEDASGALPLVLFPPVYTRFKPLIQPDTPVIIVARVQLAEASAAGGAPAVLIAEQLQPFQVPRDETELDLTVRKRREPVPAGRAAKAVPDPAQYSASGQRYFSPPRSPATVAEPSPAGPPPVAPGSEQIVITLPPLADEQADETRMLHLKDVLRRYPGPTPVMLYFPDDPSAGMPTYMPLKRKVMVSPEFCTEVEALLGAHAYELRP